MAEPESEMKISEPLSPLPYSYPVPLPPGYDLPNCVSQSSGVWDVTSTMRSQPFRVQAKEPMNADALISHKLRLV